MLSHEETAELGRAKRLLEQPRLAGRLAQAIGAPLERTTVLLPEAARQALAMATHAAVWQALEISVRSLNVVPKPRPTRGWHKALSALAGAMGGVFGLPALIIELPFSTALMLRSIAAIAREAGEDLADTETRLACVQVFALGGFGALDATRATAGSETGYYATRTALAGAVAEASRFIAERGFAADSAPAVVRLVAAVASRFGVVVSDKIALGAIPLIGAASGAVTNTLFMDHFQKLAAGHFTVRKLERRHGAAEVRERYEAMP